MQVGHRINADQEVVPGSLVESPIAVGGSGSQLPLSIVLVNLATGIGTAHFAGQVALVAQIYVPIHWQLVGVGHK